MNDDRQDLNGRRTVDRAVPPAPMPQDERGWRVAPAPDGRGMPEQRKPRSPFRRRGFWIVVLVLLALNWFSVLMTRPGAEPRVTVPFSPYFLNELDAGAVKSISSKDVISGSPVLRRPGGRVRPRHGEVAGPSCRTA